MNILPKYKNTDTFVLALNDPAEDVSLEESISAYLADQAELEKDGPLDAMLKQPPSENPDKWDFSPFPESTEQPHRKKVQKRRRKHVIKHLSNDDSQLTAAKEPNACSEDDCEATEADSAKKRTDSNTNSNTDGDYRDYCLNDDVEYSTSPTVFGSISSHSGHHKRSSHKSSTVKNSHSKVAKGITPLARKTTVHLSDGQLSTMEEHILPRALPPGLPPEILAKIKAMKAEAKHGFRRTGLPKPSPPVSSSAGSFSKRPSFPIKMFYSPNAPHQGKATSKKGRKRAHGKSRKNWGNESSNANRNISVMPPRTAGKTNVLPPPVSPNMPQDIPAGLPPPIPSGMPVGKPSGIPPNVPSDRPAGGQPRMLAAMPVNMRPPSPPLAAGSAPGLPPSLPGGLAAAGGGPAGPLPAPVEDFSWLKASLKASVDKEAVSAALEKAVTKQSAPARLLGAVRPRLAAAFSVQYSSVDCGEVAAFKGAFPGQATSSVCLICQPGGRSAAAAAVVSGAPTPAGTAPSPGTASAVPPHVQAPMAQAARGLAGMPPTGKAVIPPFIPPGMLTGAIPGRRTRRRRQQVSIRSLAGAARWPRQAGRCVPICELRDVRVKCTTNEVAHALTVVGTAVVSPASSFHKCSTKCEREWELLLQFAAAERLRAYFLSGKEVRTGLTAASRPVQDSWQVEKVLRCGSGGLTLQHGLCYPAGNWALRALLAAQNSGTVGLAALAGAGGLALIISIGLLFYFRVLNLPAFCGKLCKGDGKRKTGVGGGGGGGGGGGEKLGEGGAGTVEFVDEPPPPPPPTE